MALVRERPVAKGSRHDAGHERICSLQVEIARSFASHLLVSIPCMQLRVIAQQRRALAIVFLMAFVIGAIHPSTLRHIGPTMIFAFPVVAGALLGSFGPTGYLSARDAQATRSDRPSTKGTAAGVEADHPREEAIE